jgi:hypothetical protein
MSLIRSIVTAQALAFRREHSRAIGAHNSPVMGNLEYCRLAALRISVSLGWEGARPRASISINGRCSREPFAGQRNLMSEVWPTVKADLLSAQVEIEIYNLYMGCPVQTSEDGKHRRLRGQRAGVGQSPTFPCGGSQWT